MNITENEIIEKNNNNLENITNINKEIKKINKMIIGNNCILVANISKNN